MKDVKEETTGADRIEATDGVSKKYLWRKHCEDGSIYGINLFDYETADDYEDALIEAKKSKES